MGRASFELYLLFLCVLGGLIGLVAPATRARSTVAAFPPWAQVVWYFGLVSSGLIGMVGVVRGGILGSLVERSAMVSLAGLCASFGTASIAYAGLPAIPAVIMILGLALPCIVRAGQITADLAAVRAELRARASQL